nr:uncharacterized mitochondrial protein AtMg00810-like [Tanacetum cinerariifolium]
MLTRSMAAKLTAASASEYLFADFLSEIEPKKFEKLMTKKFEMSMMDELTHFLGLQIKQDDKGILVCQEQYTKSLLKKYNISDISSVKTPMVPPNNLGPDISGKLVNETSYRGMIGLLMYLTAIRPDIQFSIILCVRYQSNPKESHLIAVKRIPRYLKGTPTLGLYYPKCSGFDLKGYSDSDYNGCNMDRKSTSEQQTIKYAPQWNNMTVDNAPSGRGIFVLSGDEPIILLDPRPPIRQPPVTWHAVQHRRTTDQRQQSTVAIGSQWWQLTTVVSGGPSLTTTGPLLTTTGPPPPPAHYIVHNHSPPSRRHVAASNWTAASDVAPTSASVNDAESPVNGIRLRWRSAVNGGDRRSMVAVNDGHRWRTIVDHHRTIGQR